MFVVMEAVNAWAQGVYRTSLYFLLNVAVNLKLLFKKKSITKIGRF